MNVKNMNDPKLEEMSKELEKFKNVLNIAHATFKEILNDRVKNDVNQINSLATQAWQDIENHYEELKS